MCRNFTTESVDNGTIATLCDLARRSPAAGNTDALHLLVLEGDDVARYWSVTLPPSERDRFPWPGLLDAPVLVIPWVDPAAYVDRYAERDKSHTGLGDGADAWPVPYWWVDGGMAAMAMLLGCEAHGLGALFFGLFDHEVAVRETFGVPRHLRAIGALAIGHPAPEQRPSRSAKRQRRPLDEVVHRGRWSG